MNFDRLECSIQLNKDEDPSLYMAFCMMESLISDFDSQCRGALANASFGDDRFPIKLAYICNEIIKIYDAKSSEMVRGGARLGKKVREVESLKDQFDSLKDIDLELEKLDKEILNLEEKIENADALKKEYAEKEERKKELEKEVASLSTVEMKLVDQALEDLDMQKAEAERVYQGKQNDLVLRKQEIEVYRQNNIVPAEAEIEALKEKLAAEKSKVDQLTKDKAELQNSCQEAEHQIGELQGEKEAAERLLVELGQETEELQKNLSEKEEQKSAVENEISQLDSRNQEIEASILELENKKAQSLNEVIPECRQRLKEAQSALEETQLHKDAIETDIQECGNIIQEVNDQIDQLNMQKELQQQVLEQKNNTVTEIKQQIEALETECLGTEDRIQHARQVELKEKEDALAGIQEEWKKAQGELEKLQEELIKQKGALEYQKQKNQQELDEYQNANILPLNTEIAGLQSQKADFEKKCEELKAARAVLIGQVGFKEREMEELLLKKQTKEGELSVIAKKQEELSSALTTLNNSYDALVEEVGSLQTQKHVMENDRIPETERQKTAMENDFKELETQLRNLEITIMTLEDQIDHTKADIQPLLSQKETLEDTLELLTKEYNTADQEITRLAEQVKELKGKNNQQQLDQYKIQLQRKIEELCRVQQECEDIKNKIEEHKQWIIEATEQASILKQRRDETETARKKNEALLKELEPLHSPEYLEKANQCLAQLKFLEESRSQIAATIEGIGKITGKNTTRTLDSGYIEGPLKDCFKSLEETLSHSQRMLYEFSESSMSKLSK